MNYIKIIIFVASYLGMFFFGYQYAASLYKKDIAELREDYAIRAQALESRYRNIEAIQTEKLIQAWEERDNAKRTIIDMRDELNIVRQQADNAKRKLSTATNDSEDSCKAKLKESIELLEKGSELFEKGTRLFQETAIDKDSIVQIIDNKTQSKL